MCVQVCALAHICLYECEHVCVLCVIIEDEKVGDLEEKYQFRDINKYGW